MKKEKFMELMHFPNEWSELLMYPKEVATAMAPAPIKPIATGECRVSATAALGSGVSGAVSINEKTSMSGLASAPLASIALRAAATCGLKFRDPDAKDLKAGAGFAIALGDFSIELAQTSTWSELYIGIGPGPDIKIPYTPSVYVPLFQLRFICVKRFGLPELSCFLSLFQLL